MTALALLATATGLLVSTALLVLVVTFVWWLDRYDREPLLLVAGVFVWGGAVAPLLSVTSLSAAMAMLDRPLGLLAGAALEELLKALAVVLVVRYSAEFDSPTDGLVYGTAAGLGFATVENLLVVIAGVPTVPESQILVWVLQRTLFSAGVHGLATGVVGGFLGMAHLSRGALRRAGLAACGLIVGTGLHFAWNLALSTASGSARRWPVLAAMPVLYGVYLGAFWLFLLWEHRILRAELAERTPRLSAQLLEAACDGLYGEPLLDLLGAISCRVEGEIEKAAERLVAQGHRSGRDTLRGLLAVLDWGLAGVD